MSSLIKPMTLLSINDSLTFIKEEKLKRKIRGRNKRMTTKSTSLGENGRKRRKHGVYDGFRFLNQTEFFPFLHGSIY
jgi:hypothetical protein